MSLISKQTFIFFFCQSHLLLIMYNALFKMCMCVSSIHLPQTHMKPSIEFYQDPNANHHLRQRLSVSQSGETKLHVDLSTSICTNPCLSSLLFPSFFFLARGCYKPAHRITGFTFWEMGISLCCASVILHLTLFIPQVKSHCCTDGIHFYYKLGISSFYE